eukprot:914677-Amphidinium_carterae.1
MLLTGMGWNMVTMMAHHDSSTCVVKCHLMIVITENRIQIRRAENDISKYCAWGPSSEPAGGAGGACDDPSERQTTILESDNVEPDFMADSSNRLLGYTTSLEDFIRRYTCDGLASKCAVGAV